MTVRRLVVHIDHVVVEAAPDADLRALEAEVRAGLAASFGSGVPPAFARSAPVLEASHPGIRGIGAAIAGATPPRTRS